MINLGSITDIIKTGVSFFGNIVTPIIDDIQPNYSNLMSYKKDDSSSKECNKMQVINSSKDDLPFLTKNEAYKCLYDMVKINK